MIADNITETLFVEISLFSVLLLVFMLYNNVVLYKISMKDKLSLTLISAIIVSVFDGIWHFVEGAGRPVLEYTCAYVYAIGLVFGTSVFAWFTLDRFEIVLKSKKLYGLLFVAPIVLTTLLCLSTPWTNLVYSYDEHGIEYMPLFDYFVAPISFLYMGVSIFLAIYYLVLHRKKKSENISYARNLLIFAVLTVSVIAVQTYVLEIDENYVVISFAWAVGFVFFTTYVNTERFVKSRERIAAVESDLEIAANIQRGALPTVVHAFSKHSELNVFASMTTAKEVGGDFYDFFEIDGTHICFVIADVSGKGVPAALFMMVVKTMIRDHASMKLSTAEIFNDVNRLLCENNAEEMFATAWIGILDTNTRIMKCTNAGHNAVCFAKKDGSFEFLRQRHGVFLAGFDTTQYKETDIQFESGDCLFLYTDGLTEAHNASAELYGEERLLKKLNSIKIRGGEKFLREISDDVNVFSEGTDPFDDLTMMVIKVD